MKESIVKDEIFDSFFLFHTIASNDVTAPLKPHCVFLLPLAFVLFFAFFHVFFSSMHSFSFHAALGAAYCLLPAI